MSNIKRVGLTMIETVAELPGHTEKRPSSADDHGRIVGQLTRGLIEWLPSRQDASQSLPVPAKGVVHRLVVIHFRNGDKLAVPVDQKNEAYLYSCLHGTPDTARIIWFETMDRCFVGLNPAQLNAVFWRHVDAGPAATEWNPTRLTVHFADTETIVLPEVGAAEIAKLREVTLSKYRAISFWTLYGGDDEPVSISIDNMTYITMPVIWRYKN